MSHEQCESRFIDSTTSVLNYLRIRELQHLK